MDDREFDQLRKELRQMYSQAESSKHLTALSGSLLPMMKMVIFLADHLVDQEIDRAKEKQTEPAKGEDLVKTAWDEVKEKVRLAANQKKYSEQWTDDLFQALWFTMNRLERLEGKAPSEEEEPEPAKEEKESARRPPRDRIIAAATLLGVATDQVNSSRFVMDMDKDLNYEAIRIYNQLVMFRRKLLEREGIPF